MMNWVFIKCLFVWCFLLSISNVDSCAGEISPEKIGQVSEGKWCFVGEDQEKLWKDDLSSSGALGVKVVSLAGYRLTGFSESGTAKKLFLTVYASTSAEGWFNKVNANVEIKGTIEIDEENGVTTGICWGKLSGHQSSWLLGDALTKLQFQQEKIGTYSIQTRIESSGFYGNGYGGASIGRQIYFSIHKKQIETK